MERRKKMLAKTKPQRILNRVHARILTLDEIKQVSGGSTVVLNTPIMTFFGTNDPDVQTDVFYD